MMDPQAVSRHILILAHQHDNLMKLPGVIGTSLDMGADGQPIIVAYCASEDDAAAFAGVRVLLTSGNRVHFRTEDEP